MIAQRTTSDAQDGLFVAVAHSLVQSHLLANDGFAWIFYNNFTTIVLAFINGNAKLNIFRMFSIRVICI